MRAAQRTTTPIPPRASAAYQGATTRQIDTDAPGERYAVPKHTGHWLTPVGCGALLVIAAVCLWTFWIVPTYTTLLTQWHYGDAHITRLSADVGRGREDFLAFDQNGHVVVLEVNSTHPEKTRLYTGTGISLLNDTGSTIITLSLTDVNHDGKPDLVVSVGAQHYVLFNHGDSFSLAA